MKVHVIIEIAKDGGYGCYTIEEIPGFCLTGYGDSAEEAKKDMLAFYEEMKVMNAEKGIETPELTFVFKYDMASFFDYYSILNVTEVARKIGINPSQMRRYKSGLSHATQSQYDKLRDFIHKIGAEFVEARF